MMQRQRRTLKEEEIRAAYCREMDRLEPSDDLKRRTLAALACERAGANGLKPVRRLVAKRRGALPYLASAAVLLLAFGAFFALKVFLSEGPMIRGRSKSAITESGGAAVSDEVGFYQANLPAGGQDAEMKREESSDVQANAEAPESKDELLAPPMAVAVTRNPEEEANTEAAPEAVAAEKEAAINRKSADKNTKEGANAADRSALEEASAETFSPESSPYYPAARKLAQVLSDAGFGQVSDFTLATEPGTAFPAGFNLDSLHEALAEALQALRTRGDAPSTERLVSITLKSARIEGNELVYTAVLPSPAEPIELRMPRP